MLKFYNSLTRKKEVFEPINRGIVKIYSCGPTVYNFVHIGNLRSYVFSDILIKTLKYFDYDVISVMNITDVDDKTIRDSKIAKDLKNLIPNKRLKEFTDKYKKYFLDDLNSIGIDLPKIMPSAVNSIKDIEFIINLLFNKSFAYIKNDGIYFDLSKNTNYGKLVNIDFNKQKKNKCNRMINDEYDKNSVQDFALWKFKKDEDEPSWEINIGGKNYIGRPGWHIECSAMSFANLGEIFDIHTGGIDLKFPHHENEICQSSCAFGIDSQANYWMHNEHLLVNGKKMSKSYHNFYTLRDLNNLGFNSLELRENFLKTHYRQQLNFTIDSLNSSKNSLRKINNFYNRINNLKVSNLGLNLRISDLYNEKISKFEKALKDDLNTPIAIASLYEFINEINKINKFSKDDINLILNFIKKVNSVLSIIKFENNIPAKIIKIAEARKIARINKNWEESDLLRDEIKKLGFNIKDSEDAISGYFIEKL